MMNKPFTQKTDKTIKIMILEDNVAIALDLKKTLEQLGYEVTDIVSRGEEAVKKAELAQPDLIIMVIKPAGKMDGIDTAKQIREISSLPVVYLSSHLDKELIDRTKRTKPFAYLIKPFKEQELYSTIEIAIYTHNLEKELELHHQQLEILVEKRTAKLL